MKKEVLIHLKGMQTTDDPHGSDEPLELITVENIITGTIPTICCMRNRWKDLTNRYVTWSRSVPVIWKCEKEEKVQTNIVLKKKNRTWPAIRNTHIVPIQMDITTTGVNLGEEEELLEIKQNIFLGMNGQKVTDCQMYIRVTPKGSKETTFFRA